MTDVSTVGLHVDTRRDTPLLRHDAAFPAQRPHDWGHVPLSGLMVIAAHPPYTMRRKRGGHCATAAQKGEEGQGIGRASAARPFILLTRNRNILALYAGC